MVIFSGPTRAETILKSASGISLIVVFRRGEISYKETMVLSEMQFIFLARFQISRSVSEIGGCLILFVIFCCLFSCLAPPSQHMTFAWIELMVCLLSLSLCVLSFLCRFSVSFCMLSMEIDDSSSSSFRTTQYVHHLILVLNCASEPQ